MTLAKEQQSNSRRKLLKGLVATSAALAAAPTLAGAEHSHHHHMGTALNQSLIKIANECAQHGDECIAHCIELFKSGDTSLAKCADTVNEMIVMCRALAKMATYQSTELVAVAKVCKSVCQICADECGKHAKTHQNCKACADSCLECIEEINKII